MLRNTIMLAASINAALVELRKKTNPPLGAIIAWPFVAGMFVMGTLVALPLLLKDLLALFIKPPKLD
tara:strand:+ start:652 stop:852 length:201 start_codon:yes stop_codon:yes gene_type:complete